MRHLRPTRRAISSLRAIRFSIVRTLTLSESAASLFESRIFLTMILGIAYLSSMHAIGPQKAPVRTTTPHLSFGVGFVR